MGVTIWDVIELKVCYVVHCSDEKFLATHQNIKKGENIMIPANFLNEFNFSKILTTVLIWNWSIFSSVYRMPVTLLSF